MRKEISSIIYIMRAVVLALSLLLLATCDVGLGSTIDTTAPSLSIKSPTPSEVKRGTLNLNGDATDDGQISSVTVKLTGLGSTNGTDYTFNANFDGKEWNLSIDSLGESGVKDGTYQLTVTAVDESSKSSSQMTTFIVDNTPPVIIVTSPDEKEAEMNCDIQIDGKIYDATDIPEDGVTVEICGSDGSSIISKAARISNASEWKVSFDGENDLLITGSSPKLTDGTYYYRVTARDNVGNNSSYLFHKEDIYKEYKGKSIAANDIAGLDKGTTDSLDGLTPNYVQEIRIGTAELSSESVSKYPAIKYSQRKLASITWQNIGGDAMLNEGDNIIGSISPETGVDSPFKNDSFKAFIYKTRKDTNDAGLIELSAFAEGDEVSRDYIDITNAGTNRNFKINTEGHGGGNYYVYIYIENSSGTKYGSQEPFIISLSTPKLNIETLPDLKKITKEQHFTITGTALISTEDEGCNLTYELKKDGATLVSSEGISVNSSTGAWSLALPEEDGTYEYTFTAESVGFTNTKQRTVIRDTTPPTVTIASLTQNNNGTVVTVSGNASDELSGFDTSSGHTKFEYCFKQAGSAPAESDWQTKTDLSFYNWRFDIPSSSCEETSYKLYVRLTDTAGNSSTSNESILIDKENPVLTINDENANWVSNEIKTITGTASDTNFKVLTVAVGSADPVTVSQEGGNWSWTPANSTQDGIYNVVFTAEDNVGKTVQRETTFTYDRGRPSVAVTNLEEGGIYTKGKDANSILSVKGTASDSVSGVASIQYKVNNSGTYTEIENISQSWTLNLRDLPEGNNTLYVKAIDAAGNEVELSPIHFTTDYSAPEAFFGTESNWSQRTTDRIDSTQSVVLTGKAFDGSNTNTAEFSLSYSRDDGESATITDYEWNKDSSSSDYGKWSWTLPVSTGDGTYTFTLSVADVAGNTTKATRTVLIDTTAPELDVKKPAEGESVVAAYTVAGTVRDSGSKFETATGNSGIFYSFDNENWTNIPVTTASWESSQIQLPARQGLQHVYVKAVDRLGNATPVEHVEYYYDEAAPSITETSINTVDTVAKKESFTFGGVWTETNELTKITVSYTKNGGSSVVYDTIIPAGTESDPNSGANKPWQCEIVIDSTSDESGDGLKSGLYEFTITAEDAAGKSTYVIRRVRIDLIPPNDPVVTGISGTSSTRNGTTYYYERITVSGTASDGGDPSAASGIAKVQYSLTGSDNDEEWFDCAGTTNWTITIEDDFNVKFADESEYTLYFRAIDGSDHLNTGSVTRTVNIDKSSPRGTIALQGDSSNSGIVQTNGIEAEDNKRYVTFSGIADDAATTTGRHALSAALSYSKDNGASVPVEAGTGNGKFEWNAETGEWSSKFIVGEGAGVGKLEDGSYLMTLTVTDVAGKPSTATKTVILDTTGPSLAASMSSGMSFTSYDNTVTVTYFDMYAGMSNVYWKLNDEEEEHSISGNTAEIHFTEQATGQQITFGAYDTLGNKNEIYCTNLTVDAAPPSLTESVFNSAPQYIKKDGTFALLKADLANDELVATDAIAIDRLEITATKDGVAQKNNGDYWYRKTINGAQITVGDIQDIPSFNGVVANDGNWVVTVTVYDKSNHKSEKTFTFTIDATAPVVEEPNENGSYITESKDISGTIAESDTGTGIETVTLSLSGKDKNGSQVTKEPSAIVRNRTWSYPLNISEWSEGDITVNVTATDRAGNTGETVTATYKIDKNIPIIKETELGNGTSVWRSQGEFVVGGTVSDTLGLSKDGFTLTVNDEPVVLTGTNLSEVATAENGDKYYTWNYTINAEESGNYVIKADAADLSGQSAAQVTRTVKIDTEAPVITITQPTANQIVSNNSYKIKGTVIDNPTGVDVDNAGVGTLQYRYRNQLTHNGEWENWSSWTDISISDDWNFSLLFGEGELSQGKYEIEIRASDTAGNNAEVKNVVFMVDLADPVINVTENIADNSRINTECTLSGTITETNPLSIGENGAMTVTAAINGGTSVDIYNKSTGSWSYTIPVDEGDGLKRVVITATDAAGKENTFTKIVTVDTTPPVLNVTASSTADNDGFTCNVDFYDAGTDDVTVKYSLTETTDESFESTETGSGWTPIASSGTITIPVATLGEEGEKTLTVKASDVLNEIATVSKTFQFDKFNPTIESADIGTTDEESRMKEKNGAKYINDDVTLTVTASDTNPGSNGNMNVAVTVNGTSATEIGSASYENTTDGDGNVIKVTGTWKFTIPADSDGTKTIKITATDVVGKNADANRNVIVDKTAPSVNLTNPGTVSAESGFTLSADVSDSGLGMSTEGSFIKYSFTGSYDIDNPENNTSWHDFTNKAAGTANIVSLGSEGNKTIYVVASDGLNVSETKSVSFMFDKDKPSINELGITSNGLTTRTEFTLYGNVNDTNSLAEAAVTISAEGINDIVLERPAADQSTDNMILITGDNASQLGVSFMHIGEYRWTKTFAVGSDNQNEANYIPDGTYIFTITATDAANKTKVVQRTVTVDTAKPTIQAVSEAEYLPTTDDTERTSFMFRGNASDGEKSSGISKVEISFTNSDVAPENIAQAIENNKADASGKNSWSYTLVFGNNDVFNTEGNKNVYARATDTAGNVGEWTLIKPSENATFSFVYDTNDPTASVSSYKNKDAVPDVFTTISNNSFETGKEFTLKGTTGDTYGISSVEIHQIKVKENETDEEPDVVISLSGLTGSTDWTITGLPRNPASPDSTYKEDDKPVSGTYKYYAKATDRANKSTTSAIVTVIVDTIDPTVSITAPDNSESSANNITGSESLSGSSFIFRGTASDDGVGVTKLKYAFVRASDIAAGESFSSSAVPSIPDEAWQSQNLSGSSWSITQTLASMPATGRVEELSASTDGSIHEGHWYLFVKSVDKAGNESTESKVHFHVDMSSPVLTVTTDGVKDKENGTYYFNNDAENSGDSNFDVENGKYTISATATDSYGISSVTVKVGNNDAAGATLSGETWTYEVPVSDDTATQIIVAAVDKSGKTVSKKYTLYRDTTAPVVTIIAPAAGESFMNNTINLRGTVSDAGSGVKTLSYEIKQEGSSTTKTGNLTLTGESWTLNNVDFRNGETTQEGTFILTITATDDLYNTKDESVEFYVDTANPTLTETSIGTSGKITNGVIENVSTKQFKLSGWVYDSNALYVGDNGAAVTITADKEGFSEIKLARSSLRKVAAENSTVALEESDTHTGWYYWEQTFYVGGETAGTNGVPENAVILADGTYVFTITAKDVANKTKVVQRTVTVDTSVPEFITKTEGSDDTQTTYTTKYTVPASLGSTEDSNGKIWYNSSGVTVSVSVADNQNGSGLKSVEYEIQTPAGESKTGSLKKAASGNEWSAQLSLDEGENKVRIIATDEAENKAYYPANDNDGESVFVDTQVPTITIADNTDLLTKDTENGFTLSGFVYDGNGLYSEGAAITISAGQSETGFPTTELSLSNIDSMIPVDATEQHNPLVSGADPTGWFKWTKTFEIGSANAPLDGETNPSYVADGTYNLTITAKDIAERTSKVTKKVQVDTNVPVFTTDDASRVIDYSGTGYGNIATDDDGNITWFKKSLLDIAVTVADADNGSGIKSVEYETVSLNADGSAVSDSENSGVLRKVGNTDKYSATSILMNEGASNGIRIIVTDNAGNVAYYPTEETAGTAKYERIRIDTTNPTIITDTSDLLTKGDANKQFTISGTVSDGTDGSGIASVAATVKKADGTVVDGTFSMNASETNGFTTDGNWSITFNTPEKYDKGNPVFKNSTNKLADGKYNITITATDKAGRTFDFTKKASVDTTAPNHVKNDIKVSDSSKKVTSAGYNNEETWYGSTSLDVSGSFSDPNGISTVQWSWGDNNWHSFGITTTGDETTGYTCTYSGSVSVSSSMYKGTLSIKATDKAGNVATKSVSDINVDLDAPTLTILEPNPDGIPLVNGENDIIVKVQALDHLPKNGSGIEGVALKITGDNGFPTPTPNTDPDPNVYVTTGQNGVYTLTITKAKIKGVGSTDNPVVDIQVRDKFGNTTVKSFSFQKDTDDPESYINSPDDGKILNSSVKISGTAFDKQGLAKVELYYSTAKIRPTETNVWDYITNETTPDAKTAAQSKWVKLTYFEKSNAQSWSYIVDTNNENYNNEVTITDENGIEKNVRNLHFMAVAYDKAGNCDTHPNNEDNKSSRGYASYTIDQLSDCPVITFVDVKTDGTDYISTKRLSCSVEDDDGTIETLMFKKKLSDGSFSTEGQAFTLKNGLWIYEGNGIEDGLNQLYFYIKDKENGEFYTAGYPDASNKPGIYIKDTSSEKENKSLVFEANLSSPVIYENTTEHSIKIYSHKNGEPSFYDSAEALSNNMVLGGPKNLADIFVSADDANGIKSVSMKIGDGEVNGENGTALKYKDTNNIEHDIWVIRNIDVSTMSSTQTLTVTATDKAGSSSTYQFQINVDNEAPELTIISPTNLDTVTGDVVLSALTSYGISPVESVKYMIPTNNDITESSAGWVSINHTESDGNTWKIEFTYAKSNQLKEYANSTYAVETSTGSKVWKVPLAFLTVDKRGNTRVYKNEYYLYVDTEGDKPTVSISYPENSTDDKPTVLGGIIRVNGSAKDNGTIRAVYMQIDVDGDGDFDLEDKNALMGIRQDGTDVEGSKFKPIYADKIDVYGESDEEWGINFSDKENWNLNLNASSEFNNIQEELQKVFGVGYSYNGNNTIGIRVRAKDNNDLFGDWSRKVLVKIDSDSPIIGGEQQLMLIHYDGSGKSTAQLAYSSGVSIKDDWTTDSNGGRTKVGQWYLTGSIEDGSITKIEENYNDAELELYGKCVDNDNDNDNEYVASTDAYNQSIELPSSVTPYKGCVYFKIPLKTSIVSGSDSGKVEFTITVGDDNLSTEQKILINYDNSVPTLDESLTTNDGNVTIGEDNVIVQSNKKFTIEGKAHDTGTGLSRIAVYFKRDAFDTLPARIYNPAIEKGKNGNCTNIDDTNVKLENVLPTYTVESVGINNEKDTLTLTAPTDTTLSGIYQNIRKGGLVKIDGVYRKITGVSEDEDHTTVTFDPPVSTNAETVNAEFILALIVDNFMVEYPVYDDDTGALKNIANDDGDGVVESITKVSESGSNGVITRDYEWTISIDSLQIPDGPVEIHCVAFDKADSMSKLLPVQTSVQNHRPAIANIWLGTDRNKDGKVEGYGGDGEFTKIRSIDTSVSNWKKDAYDIKTIDVSTGLDTFTAVGKTVIQPEIVGGNGAMNYYYAKDTADLSAYNRYTASEVLELANTTSGNSVTFTAGVKDSSGDDVTTGRIFKWYVNNSEVVGVSEKTYTRSPFSNGTNTVKVVSGDLSATATVVVSGGAVKDVSYEPTSQYPITLNLKDNDTTLDGLGNGTYTLYFKIYDSTENCYINKSKLDGTGEGDTGNSNNSQWAAFSVKFNVQVVDGISPKATIKPFYWNNKNDNSLYQNSTNYGHIELEGELPDDTFKRTNKANETTAAPSGEYDRDPKVSGIIRIQGTAYDETNLKEIAVSIDGFKIGNVDLSTYKKIAEYRTGENSGWYYLNLKQSEENSGWQEEWSKTPADISNGWKFTVIDNGITSSGHSVEWELVLDTSQVRDGDGKVIGACTDKTFKLKVTDCGANGGNPGEGYFVDADASEISVSNDKIVSADGTALGDAVVGYRMDIVPYIAKVYTSLAKLKSNNWSVYNRTALGHYSVASNETVYLYGFNLGNNESLPKYGTAELAAPVRGDADFATYQVLTFPVSNVAASGEISITVKGVESLNNKNNNESKGSYQGLDSSLTGSKDVFENFYNRQPNGDNNNKLTDDVFLDVWQINSEAAKPVSGPLSQPVMSINPKNKQVGFAFANGPLHFSMGDETNSYKVWEQGLDFWTSIGFAYDANGNSIGTTAGGDINGDPSADSFGIFTSHWGVGLTNNKGGHNNGTGQLRIELLGQSESTNGTSFNGNNINKQRIKSPSIATTVKSSTATDTTVYLAYYDEINDEVRFKWGVFSTGNNTNGRSQNNLFYDYYGPEKGDGAPDTTSGTVSLTKTKKVVDLPYTLEYVSLIAGQTKNKYTFVPGNSNTKYTANTAVMTRDNKPVYAGQYVSIAAKYQGGDTYNKGTEEVPENFKDDLVVAVWYDATNNQMLYSYNKAPQKIKAPTYKGNNYNTIDSYSQSATGWSTPKAIFGEGNGIGEYCKVALDANGKVHIACYDNGNGDVWYAYIDDFEHPENAKTCIVDSYGIVGTELNLDVAMVNSKPVPYISYYGSSCVRPKVAYWNASEYIANASSIEGAKNEVFTTNWEVSIVPSTSKISMDHINVGVWKDSNGNLIYSTNNGEAPKADGSNLGISSAGTDNGMIYGNGSKNPILGYAVTKGAGGYIETAQMK